MTENIDELKYPIGKFVQRPFSLLAKEEMLNGIKFLPALLENALENLDESQLNTAYREEGWTVQQVVHHLADSHMHAYCRFKLAVTENNPTIKTYNEKLWAELSDVQLPINISITLLHALHLRWYEFMHCLTEDQWKNCSVFHPEKNMKMNLWLLLSIYAWHGKHHVAHITALRERMNW